MALSFLVKAALLLLAAPVRSAPIGSSFGVPGDNEYDYVVVGGGNGGAPVAYRLAEAGYSVALVEAGSFYELSNGNLSQIPANGLFFMGKDPNWSNALVDWSFVTVPQAQWNNASVHYASGKALGGGTARNLLTYHLPTKGAMQKWADQVDDQSWGFDNILRYISKSQTFTAPNQRLRFANSTPGYDVSTLGVSGPVNVGFPNYVNAFASWVFEGMQELGLAAIEGFSSGRLLGSSYVLSTVHPETGLRASSETSYIAPGLGKNLNLIIYVLTHAKRILFDDNATAIGVQVSSEGQEYTLSARKEVIVSAGAFKSPQLLMVSGVGPAATLQRHGIPVVADRPGVGQNLQDHTEAGPSYRVNLITASSTSDPAVLAQAEAQLNQRPPGGLLSNPGIDILGWEKVPQALRRNFSADTLAALAEFPDDWPEIEYLPAYGYFGDQNDYSVAPDDGYNYVSIASAVVAPLSRGTVDIASTDTEDSPIIDPAWFSNPGDLDVAVAAFKRTRQLMRNSTASEIVIGEEYYPGPQVRTDGQIREFLRNSSNTVHHACCTCAMGRSDDDNAVVDAEGRVIGTSRLRVADASAFPFLPPGHPMALIYGLGEKIADSILSEA